MTDTLRVITRTESWANAVQQDVIEALENLLERARTGEVQGLAYATALADGSVATGYTKSNAHSAIIGGLARVQHRMIAGE